MAAPHLKVVASAVDAKRPVIEIAGVSKTYRTRDGEVPSLRPLDFSVDQGEFLVVVGISADELARMKASSTAEVLEEMANENPLLTTDPNR